MIYVWKWIFFDLKEEENCISKLVWDCMGEILIELLLLFYGFISNCLFNMKELENILIIIGLLCEWFILEICIW